MKRKHTSSASLQEILGICSEITKLRTTPEAIAASNAYLESGGNFRPGMLAEGIIRTPMDKQAAMLVQPNTKWENRPPEESGVHQSRLSKLKATLSAQNTAAKILPLTEFVNMLDPNNDLLFRGDHKSFLHNFVWVMQIEQSSAGYRLDLQVDPHGMPATTRADVVMEQLLTKGQDPLPTLRHYFPKYLFDLVLSQVVYGQDMDDRDSLDKGCAELDRIHRIAMLSTAFVAAVEIWLPDGTLGVIVIQLNLDHPEVGRGAHTGPKAPASLKAATG